MDKVLTLHTGSRGFYSHRGHMSERFFGSNRPGYPHPVNSEMENSDIRVAVGDCSLTERRLWRPPYQIGKTVHVHAKHYKHNEDGRTAPGVCNNGSIPLSHSGNVVTRIGIHTNTHKILLNLLTTGYVTAQTIYIICFSVYLNKHLKSRKENPQKLTQLNSRSHPRHLVGKRTAQKDTIIDITSDSQVNSSFPNRWSPASLTFNNYFYLFLYLYIT